MYVGPPPHHILPVPTSMPGPGAGIAGQFPGIHPNMHGLQMFNNVSEAGPRFNMAGGPLFIPPCPTCPTFLVSLWPLYFPTLPIHSTYNKGWLYLLTLLLLPPPCNHLLPPHQVTMLSMAMPLLAR